MFAQKDIGKTATSEQAKKLIIADLSPSICLHDHIIFCATKRKGTDKNMSVCMPSMYTHQKSNMRRKAGVKPVLPGFLAVQGQFIVEEQKQRQHDQSDQHI